MIIDCLPNSRIGIRLGEFNVIFFPKKICSITVLDSVPDEFSFIVSFDKKRYEPVSFGEDTEDCSGLSHGC